MDDILQDANEAKELIEAWRPMTREESVDMIMEVPED